jgi:hypothetical protein
MLRCGSNPGMVGELYPDGSLKTPDVHIEALQELLNALKPSGVTELDISTIGIGPTGADRVADSDVFARPYVKEGDFYNIRLSLALEQPVFELFSINISDRSPICDQAQIVR